MVTEVCWNERQRVAQLLQVTRREDSVVYDDWDAFEESPQLLQEDGAKGRGKGAGLWSYQDQHKEIVRLEGGKGGREEGRKGGMEGGRERMRERRVKDGRKEKLGGKGGGEEGQR